MASITTDKQTASASPAHLYAPAETRTYLQNIGINPESLPRLAGMDVLLVDGTIVNRDMADPGTSELADNAPKNYRARATDLEGDPAPLNNYSMRYVLALEESIQNPSPAAGRAEHENNPDNKICIIALPENHLSARTAVGFLSGVPESLLPDKIPGSDGDWMKMILAHEIDHCINVDGTNFQREVSADKAALRQLQAEFQNSASPEIRTEMGRMFEQSRALGTFTKFDVSHATGVFIDHAADDHSQHDHFAMNVPYDVETPAKAIVSKVVDHYAAASGETRHEAENHLAETPGLFYNTLKQLNHQGAFKEGDTQQAIATEYLKAAEEFSPRYFESLQKAAAQMPDATPNAPEPQKPAITPGMGA